MCAVYVDSRFSSSSDLPHQGDERDDALPMFSIYASSEDALDKAVVLVKWRLSAVEEAIKQHHMNPSLPPPDTTASSSSSYFRSSSSSSVGADLRYASSSHGRGGVGPGGFSSGPHPHHHLTARQGGGAGGGGLGMGACRAESKDACVLIGGGGQSRMQGILTCCVLSDKDPSVALFLIQARTDIDRGKVGLLLASCSVSEVPRTSTGKPPSNVYSLLQRLCSLALSPRSFLRLFEGSSVLPVTVCLCMALLAFSFSSSSTNASFLSALKYLH